MIELDALQQVKVWCQTFSFSKGHSCLVTWMMFPSTATLSLFLGQNMRLRYRGTARTFKPYNLARAFWILTKTAFDTLQEDDGTIHIVEGRPQKTLSRMCHDYIIPVVSPDIDGSAYKEVMTVENKVLRLDLLYNDTQCSSVHVYGAITGLAKSGFGRKYRNVTLSTTS